MPGISKKVCDELVGQAWNRGHGDGVRDGRGQMERELKASFNEREREVRLKTLSDMGDNIRLMTESMVRLLGIYDKTF